MHHRGILLEASAQEKREQGVTGQLFQCTLGAPLGGGKCLACFPGLVALQEHTRQAHPGAHVSGRPSASGQRRIPPPLSDEMERFAAWELAGHQVQEGWAQQQPAGRAAEAVQVPRMRVPAAARVAARDAATADRAELEDDGEEEDAEEEDRAAARDAARAGWRAGGRPRVGNQRYQPY